MSEPTKHRRGRGEGGITKRTDGRWEATLDVGYVGGVRKRKRFYGKTRKEVSEKLTSAIVDKQRGVLVTSADARLDAYLTDWLENTIKVSRAPRTYDSYKQLVNTHINPHLGSVKLGKLTPARVQSFMATKLGEGLSARTVNYLRAILRSALTRAVKRGAIYQNVVALTEVIPNNPTREPRPLTIEQAQAFFEAIKGDRFEAAYIIAATLGLRRGEVLGLRWVDIDTNASVIRIRQQVVRSGNVDRIGPLKTKASTRTLPLTDVISAALDERRAHQATEKALAGKDWQESGLIFTNTRGGIQNPENFYVMYKRQIKAAGLSSAEDPGPTFHDLRHTATSMLVQQGVQPRVAMEILGHSNIAVTMDVYAHVVEDSMRSAISAVGAGYTAKKEAKNEKS